MRKGKIKVLHKSFTTFEFDGYIDDEKNIGYYKDPEGKWASTDLPTGSRISEAMTRKECIQETEKSFEKVLECRNKEIYPELMRKFENAEPSKGEWKQ